MVGVGRVEIAEVGVEIRQAEVAAERGIWKGYQVRVQDRHGVLIHPIQVARPQKIAYRVKTVGLENRRAVRKLRTDHQRRGRRTHIAKIEVLENGSGARVHFQVLLDGSIRRQKQPALFQSRHRLVVVRGSLLHAKFLGEKEKSLVFPGVENARDVERTADRPSEILPPIERRLVAKRARYGLPGRKRSRINNIEKIARVERFVADKVVEVSVKLVASGLRGYLHRAGRRPPVLRAVVRGQYLHFLNRIQAGIDH